MSSNQKKIAITGASGLLGAELSRCAARRGWTVIPLVRSPDRGGVFWSVKDQTVDVEALEGIDALVHLAAENLASRRWTEAQKERILGSRIQGTRLIAKSIASLKDGPEVFISASAVGYYGPRGDEWVDEKDPPGDGFLAEVCKKWEACCEPAREATRVVTTRFGVMLSEKSGALAKMKTPFKLGLGGRVSSGDQYMSWVALRDAARAVCFLIENSSLEGAVNVTSPEPVTNQEFTRALGKELGRPTPFMIPGPMLKLAYGGQMVEETLLQGQRVRPTRLLNAGFEFQYPSIQEGLKAAFEDEE